MYNNDTVLFILNLNMLGACAIRSAIASTGIPGAYRTTGDALGIFQGGKLLKEFQVLIY